MAKKLSNKVRGEKAHPLTQESYQNYGDVISARDDIAPTSANLGTAQRFNSLAQLINLRPEDAVANLCVFRCSPMVQPDQTHFEITLLERHLFSTQVFIPMNDARRYLVIVCLGKEQPELNTLRAFVASGPQGITYHPGTWHHPLVAMDEASDFACLVWENGQSGDCEVVNLDPSITATFSRD